MTPTKKNRHDRKKFFCPKSKIWNPKGILVAARCPPPPFASPNKDGCALPAPQTPPGDHKGGGGLGVSQRTIRGSQKNFSDRKEKIGSAEIFFWGPPRGPPKFCQKPSFEIQANLCKVLFHFHSKLRLGPKSGFRKIDFRPLNDL